MSGAANAVLVGCVQFDVQDNDPAANMSEALGGVARLAGRGARLILLPEMFSTGFHYPALAELAAGTPEVLERLRQQAASLGVAVGGSCPELSEGCLFNTSYLIDERGEIAASYRKIHLFSPTGEHRHFTAGCSPALGVAAGLNLGLLTCYDLRFPELARSLNLAGAQMLCVVAQWPAARISHWRLLARARALENQLFVCACNRCGASRGLEFGGGSLIASPRGEVLAEAGEGPEDLLAEVHPARVEDFRRHLPALAERRPQAYHLPRPAGGKVVSRGELAQRLARIRAGGGKIVFTNGCFDLLHVGHIRYLARARSLGDCLVVGLNTDGSVHRLKGEGRPVVPEARRAEVLAALEAVDFVVLFAEETPEQLIAELQPDVLVKGADWEPGAIAGRQTVEARGGRVVRVEVTPDSSTSALIDRIRGKGGG
jgi:rfaE bifunctional protein nucleotidyltransferase chain/domain